MGGGSYSKTWADSIRGKYQTSDGYSVCPHSIFKYAQYNDPINAKKTIAQYIKKKKEIQNCRLSKKHEEFFDIIKELLDILREIDNQQAEILTGRYEQLLKECKQLLEENNKDRLEKINKRYVGLLDAESHNFELKLEPNYEVEFLLRLDYFMQWLDETLKNYKLYPEEQENRAGEIKTLPSDKKSFLEIFRDLFEGR